MLSQVKALQSLYRTIPLSELDTARAAAKSAYNRARADYRAGRIDRETRSEALYDFLAIDGLVRTMHRKGTI